MLLASASTTRMPWVPLTPAPDLQFPPVNRKRLRRNSSQVHEALKYIVLSLCPCSDLPPYHLQGPCLCLALSTHSPVLGLPGTSFWKPLLTPNQMSYLLSNL